MDRKEIEKALLEYAEEQSKEYKYAYAFGWVFATLDEPQLKVLSRWLEEKRTA